jgi:hypothetical protein
MDQNNTVDTTASLALCPPLMDASKFHDFPCSISNVEGIVVLVVVSVSFGTGVLALLFVGWLYGKVKNATYAILLPFEGQTVLTKLLHYLHCNKITDCYNFHFNVSIATIHNHDVAGMISRHDELTTN